MSAATDLVIKHLVYEVALEQVMKRIITAVPFLGWAVINPIFAYLMGNIAKYLYEELSKVVDFAIIDMEIGSHKIDYDNSINVLRVEINKPEGQRDEEAIRLAREEAKRRLRDLVAINVRRK